MAYVISNLWIVWFSTTQRVVLLLRRLNRRPDICTFCLERKMQAKCSQTVWACVFAWKKSGKDPDLRQFMMTQKGEKELLIYLLKQKNRTGKYTSKTLSFNNSLFLPVVNNTKKEKELLIYLLKKKQKRKITNENTFFTILRSTCI